jgi:AmmeMemoRadiSam system protein B
MKVRERTLPSGWYPDTGEETEQVIRDFLKIYPKKEETILAGIVPHAGWTYSGSMACGVISLIDRELTTIVVVGGHLSQIDMVYAAFDEGYYTPLVTIQADTELLSEIRKEIAVKEDKRPDNTVEIQLPLIKYFFPESRIVWLRAAPSDIAIVLGKVIHACAAKLNTKAAVIGSTDLTHYGSNYGFSPKGFGKQAVQWVKEVNDKQFIDACLSMDPESALHHANFDHSACSAGGAVCALSFARESGVKKGTLLDYKTSYDVMPAESFVGYAGILYS